MPIFTLARTFCADGRIEVYVGDAPAALSQQQLRFIEEELLAYPGTTTLGALPSQWRRDYLCVGPRLSMETPESSNTKAILESVGIIANRFECFKLFPIDASRTREALKVTHLDEMTQQLYTELPNSFVVKRADENTLKMVPLINGGADALRAVNREFGLAMDDADIDYYAQMFRQMNRDPRLIEVRYLGAINADHSRHHSMNAAIIIDGRRMPQTLFEIVKGPHKKNRGVTLVAFSDNASAIMGPKVPLFQPVLHGEPSTVGFHFDEDGDLMRETTALVIKAETHNHPTYREPYNGAATGEGGVQRDGLTIGRGASFGGAAIAGYAIGNLRDRRVVVPGEYSGGTPQVGVASPLRILIEGSDGASNFNNEVGRPLIAGFVESFEQVMPDGAIVGWRKPILFAGDVTHAREDMLAKIKPEPGMHIVQFGGPVYPVGENGSSASSLAGGDNKAELDLASVQRGNAEKQQGGVRVIHAATEMGERNPLVTVNDSGAAGVANVTSETAGTLGGTIDLGKLNLGDPTMTPTSKLLSEPQERFAALVRPEDLQRLKDLCAQERVGFEDLGVVRDDGKLVFLDSSINDPRAQMLIELNVKNIFNAPRKELRDTRITRRLKPLEFPRYEVSRLLRRVLKRPSAGSKGYLVTKVDRSVTGLVAMQPTVGAMQVPTADVGVYADSYFTKGGAAVALGLCPIEMQIDAAAGARLSVGRMYTGINAAYISGIPDVRCQANWMWPLKNPGELARIYDAAVAMSTLLVEMHGSIIGGKDSMSMKVTENGQSVSAPGTLVITGQAPVGDVRRVATPAIEGNLVIGFLDLGYGQYRLGGSALAQSFGQLGDECPDLAEADRFREALEALRILHMREHLKAYHDRSDGGLITSLVEMCAASNQGMMLDIPRGVDPIAYLFNEELGVVFAYKEEDGPEIEKVMARKEAPFRVLGRTTPRTAALSIKQGNTSILTEKVTTLRVWYEQTSTALDRIQATRETASAEAKTYRIPRMPDYVTPRTWRDVDLTAPWLRMHDATRPRAAVIREEGTNGDREMLAALYMAGFEPSIIAMNHFLSGHISSLAAYQMVVLPGGFSFKDACGAGVGWAAVVKANPIVQEAFAAFRAREDTLHFGVCNGFQAMTRMGLLPGKPWLLKNSSKRFESRWVTATIEKSPSVFFEGMEGMTFGTWVAHGEGRLYFEEDGTAEKIATANLSPVRYSYPDSGSPTTDYPYNPNGSPLGMASLCSQDGRVLGMMPHPERSVLSRQCPWLPESLRSTTTTPWLMLFQNAQTWCRTRR